MANPIKGEVGFEADGEAYTLSFGINALCSLEDALGMSVQKVGAELQADGLKLKTLRTVFWAGLQDRHEGVTEREAGDLMDGLGAGEVATLVVRAFAAAFPPAEVGRAKAGPRKRATASGTGPSS